MKRETSQSQQMQQTSAATAESRFPESGIRFGLTNDDGESVERGDAVMSQQDDD